MAKPKPQPDFDTCPACEQTKPIAEFGRKRRRADCCADNCIACQDACRARRTEAKRAKGRERYADCRRQVLAHYGAVCACCGEDRNLTVDHVHGRYSGHYQDKGDLWTWLARHGFPDGYQILCGRCNSSKNNSGRCRLDHKPLADDADPAELLRMKDAAAEAGIAIGTLTNHIRRGTWPQPDDLSDGIKRWRRDTVRAAMEAKRVRTLGRPRPQAA